ncbi:MAG: response regulator transcription factor [Anaerolineales bacterium]|nr:response regulator transcription factor [Anaerolineales bacterium]
MKANILVVDDEPVARQSMTDILKLEGFNVISAANGQTAVEYIRTHHVDLMIVDLRMPGMSGLEVVQVANQVSPDTEVVLLTAFGSTETAVEALRLRIHDYLLKPVSPKQVITSVNKGLARREAKLKTKGAVSDLDIECEVTEIVLQDNTIIDLARREVRNGGKVIQLTPAEGRLLQVFVENVGRVYSHRDLVLFVQGYETSHREAPEILRPLVSRLRQKLTEFPSLAERVVSVRGTGYVFEPEMEE